MREGVGAGSSVMSMFAEAVTFPGSGNPMTLQPRKFYYNKPSDQSPDVELPVEPQTLAGIADGPASLDALNLLTIYSGYGTAIGAEAIFDIEFSRDAGVTYVKIPNAISLRLGLNDGVAERNMSHVFENPFPNDFMRDSAAAVDIDDVLQWRMVLGTGGIVATGPASMAFVVILSAGRMPSAQTPHRGSIFSAAQYR